MIEKPSYGTSKKALWLSSIGAWSVILVLAIGAVLQGQSVAFGQLAVPIMAALIAAMLGIHRHYGTKDMEIIAAQPSPSPSAYDARADPAQGAGLSQAQVDFFKGTR